MKLVKKLWVPVFLFVLFIIAATAGEGILGQFGVEAITSSKRVFEYMVQIGLWISTAFLINRIMRVFFWNGLVARALDAPVPRLLTDVTAVIIYMIAFTGILSFVFNQSVTGVWAASGLVGIVLGLALQNIILDLFIGIATNIERPYRIGDFIAVHPSGNPDVRVFGELVEINWRTTRIQTTEDNIVMLPNSMIGKSMVTNVSLPDKPRRLETTLTLDPAVPTERAKRVLLASALAVADDKHLMRDPVPRVLVAGTIPGGVVYNIRFYSWRGTGESIDRVLKSGLAQLHQAGIPLAYPKQDIYHAELTERRVDVTSIEGLAKLLGHTELFQKLKPEELHELAAAMIRARHEPDSKIIESGAVGDSLIILVEGLLDVSVTMENMKQIRVGQIVPGEFIGEMSLLTGEPRSADVTANTSAITYELTRDTIVDLLEKRPEIAGILSTVVADRQLRNSETFANASAEDKEKQKTSLANQILGRMKAFFRITST